MSRIQVQLVHFKSRSFAEVDARDAYRDLYDVGSDSSFTGPDFAADIWAVRLPGFLLFDRRLRGVSHGRSPLRIARDGMHHFTIHLVLEGRYAVEAGEARRIAEPGEMVVVDLSRPQRTWADDVRLATISLPSDTMRRGIGTMVDPHGFVLPRRGTEALSAFIASLARDNGAIDDPVAAGASEALVALLRQVFTAQGRPTPPAALPDAARLIAILEFIETHLADPGLGPALISDRLGMSRSVLYRLFEPLGGVSERIQQRRLRALHAALSGSADTRSFRRIAELSGFSSPSHASRVFRAAHGMPPGAFRRSSRGDASIAPARTAWPADLAAWIADFR